MLLSFALCQTLIISFRSVVVHHLQKQFLKDDTIAVLYIYFDYNSQNKLTMPRLLECLLRQLVRIRALSSTADILSDYKRKDSRPSPDEIADMLAAEFASYSRVLLLVDALDESPDDVGPCIGHVLSAMFSENISMLFTSRDIPEISQTFANDARIEIVAHDKDIRAYITLCLKESPWLRRLVNQVPSMKQELYDKVLGMAKGM